MDNKDLVILRHVVDIHIREGGAVSSLRVKNVAGLGISTATIRNAMARLERGGYLTKPHTSAGRVPTDRGYRRYVDHLDSQTRYGETFVSRLRDELRDRAADPAMIMACASRILGALSKNLAVVYGFVTEESVVGRVQIVQLEGTRLLVVIYLEPEREQTSVLQMDRRFTASAVKLAERRLNDALKNKSVSEAKESLRSAMRDNITEAGIIAREVAIRRESILSEAPAVELYFEERDHIMAQPELSDPRLLQMLLGLLHNKTYLTRVLSGRVSEGTQVTIGHENVDQHLQAFSLVTAGYRMGVARGTLGVIGPTRMRYDLVQALVGTAARELRALGEEYF